MTPSVHTDKAVHVIIPNIAQGRKADVTENIESQMLHLQQNKGFFSKKSNKTLVSSCKCAIFVLINWWYFFKTRFLEKISCQAQSLEYYLLFHCREMSAMELHSLVINQQQVTSSLQKIFHFQTQVVVRGTRHQETMMDLVKNKIVPREF